MISKINKKYFVILLLLVAWYVVGVTVTFAADYKVHGGYRWKTEDFPNVCTDPNPLTGSCSCPSGSGDLFAKPNGGGGSAGDLYMCKSSVGFLEGWQGGYMIRKSDPGTYVGNPLNGGAPSCPTGSRNDIVADVEGPSDSANWIHACTKTGATFTGPSRSTYGGSFHLRPGVGCVVNNSLTGTCGCPSGYTDLKISDVTGSGGSFGEFHTCYYTPPPPPVDVCPNIAGDQATVPPGYIINGSGNCVPILPDTGSVQGLTYQNIVGRPGLSVTVTDSVETTITTSPNYSYFFNERPVGNYTYRVINFNPGFVDPAEYNYCRFPRGGLPPATCHDGLWSSGNSVSLSVNKDETIDLWWRFTPAGGGGGPTPENCTDGIDNDGDGLIDSADPDCPLPVDICPNIAGLQTTIPAGHVIDDDGNCVPLPPRPETTIISPKDDVVVNGPMVLVGGVSLMEVVLDWSFSDPIGGAQERYRIELADTTDGTCATSYSNACLNAVVDFKKSGGTDPHNDDIISLAEGGSATLRTVHLAPGRNYRWRVRGYSTVDNPDGSVRYDTSPSEVFRTASPAVPLLPTVDLTGPSSVNVNTDFTLTWTVSDADTCTASMDSGSTDFWSGSKNKDGGSQVGQESITGVKEYKLTCTNNDGSGFDTHMVTVNSSGGILPIASLNASPRLIFEGQSSTLTWSCQNSALGVIDQGIGTVCSDEVLCAAGGVRSVTPAQTTKYTLTCTSPNGIDIATDTATVQVGTIIED